jgi:alkylation response protein AidB-like acyl-CoA dehydrogenase
MDFDWSPEEQAFRQEIRDFLATELTDDVKGSIFIDTQPRMDFVTKMADRGWLGMGFPEKYGGSPAPMPLAQFILTTELDRAGAPIIGKNVGTVGSTIFHVGSEEMKMDLLPRIFKNEGQWSITYSEPSAGTDIGSLQTRAEDMGDHFLVNGMKHYITSAHFCKWHFMAVRTDPDAPKHKGISILIVDHESEGLTISPMNTLGREGTTHRTNQVFFDNVKVPKSRLLGEVNKGFYYMMQALDYERFAILSFASRVRRFNNIVNYYRDADFSGEKPAEDPVTRRQLARMAGRVEVGIMLERLAICKAQEAVPQVEAAMNKAWGASIGDEMAQLALDLSGPFGGLWDCPEYAPMAGKLMDEFLMAGHARVAAGGVDTSKSIIARTLLGLPNALAAPKPMKNK